jgi:hypothetical protein
MKMRKLFLIPLILFFTLSFIKAQIELQIPRITQLDGSWCWAASSKMIFDYQRNPSQTQKQCDIALIAYNLNTQSPILTCNCNSSCSTVGNICGRALWDTDFLRIFDYYNYKWRITNNLDWSTTTSLINAFRPFIVSQEVFRNEDSRCKATHYLTAKGWCQPNDNCKFILVADPGACKNQNIIAINAIARATYKICTAIIDTAKTSISANKAKVITNAPTCKLIKCDEVFHDIAPQMQMMMAKKKVDKKLILDDSIFYKPIKVEYVEIINNKLVTINQNPIYDIPRRIPNEDKEYVINRIEKIDGVWETQMVLTGNYDNNFTIDPLINLGGFKFTLDPGLFSKVILVPEYMDFYRFSFKGKVFYATLSDCKDCKSTVYSENRFIKIFYNNTKYFGDDIKKSK